ncbi:MAG: LysM peptidoglycan-binding domain-containing protein [Spirochaetota bacterium]
MIYHIIKKNDTLQRISSYYYGDWSLDSFIRDYNKIQDDIHLGQSIQIPIPLYQEQEYIVQGFESYQRISLAYYYTEHYSEKIRSYNEDLILSENAGVTIIIPPLANYKKLKKAFDRLRGEA